MAAPTYATEIAALEAAAATGELTVEQDGDRVTYRSMDDLLKALTYFKAQAAAASPAARRQASRSTVAGYSAE